MVHDAAATPGPGWHGVVDANAFVGFNNQARKFRDFRAWESQNWVMGVATHSLASGVFRVTSMISLEPFTLHEIGSPQVFQTGETFHGAPLIDYQHPHDLIMGLGTDYSRAIGATAVYVGADVVGSPTLGPDAFMHRPSAYGNPQAPLAHHYLDSTHITPGVVRGGLRRSGWGLEGSWFHGREPDERRTDIDLGALDSYAVRVSWMTGPWATQVSAAALHEPEATTPYDAKRITASVTHSTPNRRLDAWLFAFGQNREAHGNFEAYLFEAHVTAGRRSALFVRAESVDKDILDAGFHPRGVFHRHRHSQVGAFTGGYLFTIARTKAGLFDVGADVTGYAVPANLQEPYGTPWSVHVFVHYSLRGPGAMHH